MSFNKKIGQIIAQSIVSPKMAEVYIDLFSYSGSEFYSYDSNESIEDFLSWHKNAIPVAKLNKLFVVSKDEKDIHKKRAGYDDLDDDSRYENYLKSLPKEKRFISYVNPYSRNYADSDKKKNLMKEYDKKYFKKFYKLPNIIANNIYIRDDSSKNSNRDNIKKNKNYGINKRYNLTDDKETKNDLMMTSLHYTGLDNDINNKENKKKLELKLPEITMI